MSYPREHRSWNQTPAEPSSEGGERPSNPFGGMRRDRNSYSSGMSYSQWKVTEQKKKEEQEKNRPLTEDDFPPLGGKPVVVKNPQVDGVSLASRIASAIKREEDEAHRRRLQQEEEEKTSKEAVISLPMFRHRTSAAKQREEEKQKREQEMYEEEQYHWQVNGEVEEPQQ